ncbi:hypothetical protein ACJX0J_025406, partial [Zea mays]
FVEQLFLKFPSKPTSHPPSSSAHRALFAACDDRRLIPATSFYKLRMWGNDRQMEFVR